MRMKFNKSSQLLLVSAASILVAGLMTACATLTVDFVFVASSKAAGPNNYGEINIFEVNSESGHMRQISRLACPFRGTFSHCRSRFVRQHEPVCREPGRQQHRPVRHRQRRQALSV